jgi:hypothetical protein
MAVVDNNLLIISAYTGWPGCTHDARVLRNSILYKKAEEGQAVIQNHHILADNAYPLRNWQRHFFQTTKPAFKMAKTSFY